MNRFTGKTIIVTGGAGGIGAATGLAFAREGGRVALFDMNESAVQETSSKIARDTDVVKAGGTVDGYACDITDEIRVNDQVNAVVQANGSLDVLVNNAGITRDALLHKMELDDWNAVLSTNLTGTYLCARAAQAHMVRQKAGKIVNVSSRSALGNRGQANYAAAKAGVQGFTATLAIELGPFGINVNAVAPGFISTPMTAATAARVGSEVSDYEAAVAARTPLGRVGMPEEIASVITFLASHDANYVSGQTLYVNGGAR